ncbi:MAG: hypothetical protein JOZ79_04655, partial [Sphingomonas sp.]|nr:hypothetical protein [Sphingomonas sp.]
AELVSLRATVSGVMPKPPQLPVTRGEAEPEKGALRAEKPVYYNAKFLPTKVYRRPELRSGNRVEGPALIEEHASTTVIFPGDVMTVDEFGNLVIEIGSERNV